MKPGDVKKKIKIKVNQMVKDQGHTKQFALLFPGGVDIKCRKRKGRGRQKSV